jgi:ectoine hydroxylase-related dioxygenase (phytanoyl-CoA dioxygenase family)
MKQLTLHPNVAAAAKKLAGCALRLWHDHIISKLPHNGRKTEFHQDQPYWPHSNSTQPISCWIALCDVPQKKGCMSFIPKSHLVTDIDAHYLGDDESLYRLAPQLEYEPKITLLALQ